MQVDAHGADVALTRPVRVPDVRAAHRVCWEAPAPLAPRLVRLPCEAQDQRALLPVKDPACVTMALLTTAERS